MKTKTETRQCGGFSAACLRRTNDVRSGLQGAFSAPRQRQRTMWVGLAVSAIVMGVALLPGCCSRAQRSQGEGSVAMPPVALAEGLEFEDVVVGDRRNTKDAIKAKIGWPDDEEERWLNYRRTHGLDFYFRKDLVLSEIRLNRGFKGRLGSGISLSSRIQDVFRVYGKPVSRKTSENLHRKNDEKVLYTKGDTSRIYYGLDGLIFWFRGETINQIVLFRGRIKGVGDAERTLAGMFRPVSLHIAQAARAPTLRMGRSP